jgi:hypothetical protein
VAYLLIEFMQEVCGLEPREYVLSDESYLSELDTAEPERLFAKVREL